MSPSNMALLRWLITGAVVVLAVVIVLQFGGPARPSGDATLLLKASSQPVASVAAAAAGDAPPAPPASGAAAALVVDVIGAVRQPGVYRLPPAARVDDVVRAAGGFAPDVDREQVNLAAPVADGQQIRVPRIGEQLAAPAASAAASTAAALIDINTADVAVLDSLPGIGPTTAAAIVAHREQQGLFKRIDDLQEVKGIGPSLYEKISPLVVVGP